MLSRSSSVILLFSVFFFIIHGCNTTEKEKDKEPAAKNRLAEASSPYLQEHADNPVDWYEWGNEALEKAKKEDKPIVISIGYSACHWCHVMEEESFMDSTVAAIMNNNFISIKVDREQRPDLDKIYMNAAQLLNGSGGWPLNILAMPDGKPFYAGTYFPKDKWKELLKNTAVAFNENRDELESTANALTQGIKKTSKLNSFSVDSREFRKEEYVSLLYPWKGQWDDRRGGYKGAQKFPLPMSWDALLEYYYLTNNEEVLQFVNTTLTKMLRGGIYDQVGGGFSRYTTDNKWNVPHFEKMLYDNAQLISLYSHAYKLTKNEEYFTAIKETIDFVENELSNGSGAYFSSVNADSEGEEGKYYVWTEEEIRKILPEEEAKLITDFYNITSYGNWEKGKNVLYRTYSYKEYARKKNIAISDFKQRMSNAMEKLKAEREARKEPSVDNKVLTAWNALMINAYLDAYTALGDKKYLDQAVKIANFIKENMIAADYSLRRNYTTKNIAGIAGFLDDYANLSEAYINLYQVNFDLKWLNLAAGLSEYAVKNFGDANSGMFYYTAEQSNDLISRNFEFEDNVLPSSNSVMAKNLYVLGELTENKEYLKRSEQMLQNMRKNIEEQPFLYANWTKLMGVKAFGAYEVAIMGKEAVRKNLQMQEKYLPTALFMGGTSENLPLLEAKLVPEQTLIYVCQNKTCKYPVSETTEAFKLLNLYNSETSVFSQF